MWMCPWKVRVRRVGAVRSTKQEPARPERPSRVGHGVREQASHLVCRQMEEGRVEIEALSPGEGCFFGSSLGVTPSGPGGLNSAPPLKE